MQILARFGHQFAYHLNVQADDPEYGTSKFNQYYDA